MAIVHNQQSPSSEEKNDGIEKYKTFGFAQSLDVVGRWYYQLSDAEKVNVNDTLARDGLRKKTGLSTTRLFIGIECLGIIVDCFQIIFK